MVSVNLSTPKRKRGRPPKPNNFSNKITKTINISINTSPLSNSPDAENNSNQIVKRGIPDIFTPTMRVSPNSRIKKRKVRDGINASPIKKEINTKALDNIALITGNLTPPPSVKGKLRGNLLPPVMIKPEDYDGDHGSGHQSQGLGQGQPQSHPGHSQSLSNQGHQNQNYYLNYRSLSYSGETKKDLAMENFEMLNNNLNNSLNYGFNDFDYGQVQSQNQNLGQANQNLGQAQMGQANQNLGQANQNLGQANQNLGQANQNLAQGNQNLGQNLGANQNLGQNLTTLTPNLTQSMTMGQNLNLNQNLSKPTIVKYNSDSSLLSQPYFNENNLPQTPKTKDFSVSTGFTPLSYNLTPQFSSMMNSIFNSPKKDTFKDFSFQTPNNAIGMGINLNNQYYFNDLYNYNDDGDARLALKKIIHVKRK